MAIVGYRAYPLLDLVRAYVLGLPLDTVVISGWNGDPNEHNDVDKTAILAASDKGLETVCHPAEWTAHGKAAGPIRNTAIVAEADDVVAFDHPLARGTKDTIKKARAAGKLLVVFDQHGAEIHRRPRNLFDEISS